MTVDRTGAFFRRFGVAATWRTADYTDGGTGTVILDTQGEDALGNAISTIDYEAEYQATEFVGMSAGDELEISGVCYEVRDPRPVDDGAVMRVGLSKNES